ncbi:MAG: tetratricopeptide repeat protein [Myxococcota bacterium]
MTIDLEELGLDRRFEVVREIGRGAASRVLAVRDRLHRVKRALKIATRKGQVRRYRAEYRRMLELRHPNIVRAYDFGIAAGGQPYYTLELVHGTNFGAFRERADPEVLGVVAMQVLDALVTLHARGWVHRDLKPRNILVVGKGTASLVRLIDFGLMAPVGEAAKAAGTLPYIAPEVARGEAIDGRADLYSFGMVLYEALVPEDMAKTIEDVARRLEERPIPPNRANPVIPGALSDFVMRLIEPDPGRRFPNAAAAVEALSRLPGLRFGRGPARAAAERLLRCGAVSHRTRSINKVRRWAKSVTNEGQGCVCVLDGSVGVGKTPFMRELSMTLNLDGLRVVRVRSTKEPGSPVAELLEVARSMYPESSSPQLPSLRVLDPSGGGRELSRFAGQAGMTLAVAFGSVPTALLIDDLHRAEPVAIEALRSMAQEIKSQEHPVSLLVICTGDPRPDGIALAETLGPDVRVVTLQPLRHAEVQELAAQRLRGLSLPKPALDRLVNDSQGMPSLVERTLARLLVDGTIQAGATDYTFIGGRYVAVGHVDADLLAARIAQVKEEQRDVLWAAAVLGHGIDASGTARVAGVPLEVAQRQLGELGRLELLVPTEASDEPGYTFANRALLAAVYQDIPVERRRVCHDRAACVLAELPRTSGRVEEVVEHRLKGSDDDKAVSAAVEAGERAATVYADRRAIEYFSRAYARLKGTADSRAGSIALQLGRLFERTGELERASVWFQAAVSAAESDRRVKIEATLGLGAVALVRGLSPETDAHAQRALELIGESKEPRLEAVARRLLALVAVQGGDTQRAEKLLLSALRTLELAGAEHEAIEVLLDLARIFKQRGEIIRGVRYARRAQHRARVRGDPSALAEASTVLGRGFLQAARFRAARRALFRGLRVTRASGDRLRQASVLREIGNLRFREGDLEGALERYEHSLELVRASRARSDESACLHNIGVVRTRLGEFRAAVTALQTALDVANEIGDVQGAALSAGELGHTFAVLGDLDRARTVLANSLEVARTLDDVVIAAESSAIAAWVDLRDGNAATWHALVERLDALLDPLEDPANRALALYYAGCCAVWAGDGERAVELGRALSSEVEAGSLGDLRVAAVALRGQAAAITGEQDEAIQLLRSAARDAARGQLRPLEVEIRVALARVLAGSDPGAEQITRAMEIMQSTVRSMSDDMMRIYLGRPESVAARALFRHEVERVFGGDEPPPAQA